MPIETTGSNSDGNENVTRQVVGLYSKTITLQVRDAFLYMSLPSLLDYDVKMPNFTFFGERKQAHEECFFLFLNLSVVLSRGNTRTNSQSNSYVILRPKCFSMSLERFIPPGKRGKPAKSTLPGELLFPYVICFKRNVRITWENLSFFPSDATIDLLVNGITTVEKTFRVVCTMKDGENFVGWFDVKGNEVTARPIPDEIIQGNYVEESGNAYTLVIQEVVVADGGVYTCKGDRNESTFTLYVECKYLLM